MTLDLNLLEVVTFCVPRIPKYKSWRTNFGRLFFQCEFCVGLG